MSAADLFGADLWKGVGEDLRGEGGRWWRENREDLVNLGAEEMREMLQGLKDGGTVKAKQALALRWAREDRETWEAYRDGTTAQLEGIAARRARLMEALAKLGIRAAETLGRAAMGALGL